MVSLDGAAQVTCRRRTHGGMRLREKGTAVSEIGATPALRGAHTNLRNGFARSTGAGRRGLITEKALSTSIAFFHRQSARQCDQFPIEHGLAASGIRCIRLLIEIRPVESSICQVRRVALCQARPCRRRRRGSARAGFFECVRCRPAVVCACEAIVQAFNSVRVKARRLHDPKKTTSAKWRCRCGNTRRRGIDSRECPLAHASRGKASM